MYELRPYQQTFIDNIKISLAKKNKKILGILATGGGKSIIIYKIFEMALKKNPNAKLLYIVHRTILVNQVKELLKGLNVEVSTLQTAGKNPTICYDIVLSDETHYGQGSKLMKNINYSYFIGVTATGITPDNYKLDGFDDVVIGAELIDLVNLGFMPPLKVLSTGKIDTKTIKKSGKDFNQKSVFDVMSKSEVVKDIVQTYKRFADGLKTIVYCVNVEHSEQVAKEFIAAGYRCRAIHSKSSDKSILQDFKDNKIDILTNVEVLTTGLDMKDIYCLMLASPTKSFIKSTQIYGRLRLNSDDKNKVGLILDCSKVIEETQHPYQRFDFNRTKQNKKTKECCDQPMQILSKTNKMIDNLTYVQTTIYKCNVCNTYEDKEEMKVLNLKFCAGCGEQLTDNKIEFKETKSELVFYIECEACQFVNKERSILLTDKELKEIEHKETLEGGNSWEKIDLMLKASCKRCNYQHQYKNRLLEHLKSKNYDIDMVVAKIESLDANNKKISLLMYWVLEC